MKKLLCCLIIETAYCPPNRESRALLFQASSNEDARRIAEVTVADLRTRHAATLQEIRYGNLRRDTTTLSPDQRKSLEGRPLTQNEKDAILSQYEKRVLKLEEVEKFFQQKGAIALRPHYATEISPRTLVTAV